MLLSFALTNHRSIRERISLSMVAEARPTTEGRAVIEVPGFDQALIPAAAIVGANGSGKSNVLDGLEYIASAVRNSHHSWSAADPPPRRPFQAKSGPMLETPSIYELVFVADDAVYEYEFRVGARAIDYEHLLVAPSGSRTWTRLFERQTGPNGAVDVRFGRRLHGPRAIAAAATRPNSLFLSTAAQSNVQQLLAPWRAIASGIRSADPHDRASRMDYTARRFAVGDTAYRARLRRFISSADLGIKDVSVTETELPEEQFEAFKQILAVANIDAPSSDDLRVTRTVFAHRGDVGVIDLDEESAGTRAWFEWASPVIDALDEGYLLGADEVDAHLNSQLAAQIVMAFQQPESNTRGAQIIFSLQDPAVLSQAQMGRDQLWIAEKDEHGSTTLVAATDFAPRRDWDMGNAVRHGRLGGLPVIDDDEFHTALSGDLVD